MENKKSFHQKLSAFKLTKNQLVKHGYPQESGIGGQATIQNPYATRNIPSNQRECGHCQELYAVDSMGQPLVKEVCMYHTRAREDWSVETHPCCGQLPKNGCTKGASHVARKAYEPAMLSGFKRIPQRSSIDSDDKTYGAYAMDCEMLYTKQGLELAKVAVLDMQCNVVYQTLVKPDNIVDYHVHFTGITKQIMDPVTTKLADVQAKMMELCNSETILIGHSLESDMAAMKLFHNSIVDTSIMYPHRRPLPMKKALRTLSKDLLGREIQHPSRGSHDCVEDARTCVQLVKLKIR